MDFSLNKINDRVMLLKPASRINMGNVQLFDRKAQDAADGGAHYLIIDMSEVESITSAGLRSIYTAHQAFSAIYAGPMSGTQRSPYIKLIAPTPYVLRVLEVSGFIDLIEIHQTMQEALASCK